MAGEGTAAVGEDIEVEFDIVGLRLEFVELFVDDEDVDDRDVDDEFREVVLLEESTRFCC